MANNINRVLLTGNLTRDPELVDANGTSICRMRIAVNERRKDASGEWGDRSNYFDVTAFGAQGENCARYLEKGRPVAVDGRLHWREWETPEGQKRQAVSVIAQTVQFLGGGERSGAAPPTEEELAAAAAMATPQDDIPF